MGHHEYNHDQLLSPPSANHYWSQIYLAQACGGDSYSLGLTSNSLRADRRYREDQQRWTEPEKTFYPAVRTGYANFVTEVATKYPALSAPGAITLQQWNTAEGSVFGGDHHRVGARGHPRAARVVGIQHEECSRAGVLHERLRRRAALGRGAGLCYYTVEPGATCEVIAPSSRQPPRVPTPSRRMCS